MIKTAASVLTAVVLLSACTYADQRFVSDQSPAEMRANSMAVQDAERAERAERRRERREEMMNEADAINRAYGNRKVYILH
ncbi:hypothetical protein BG910_08730 [Neisseria chenwenguii]|uniref:Lipoprotein n=1 Tax=Neisseria chenwenguii TaxID=1853278 RepID=A0A220S2T8_9NEIS|nr:hypothetical protein [Neisseria chenwenguii]ASK27811.1 hypothetical protein BG910_08730 [Neisseria chenwenguii]